MGRLECVDYDPPNWTLIGLCGGFATLFLVTAAVFAGFYFWQRRLKRLAVLDKTTGPPGAASHGLPLSLSFSLSLSSGPPRPH